MLSGFGVVIVCCWSVSGFIRYGSRCFVVLVVWWVIGVVELVAGLGMIGLDGSVGYFGCFWVT